MRVNVCSRKTNQSTKAFIEATINGYHDEIMEIKRVVYEFERNRVVAKLFWAKDIQQRFKKEEENIKRVNDKIKAINREITNGVSIQECARRCVAWHIRNT